MNEVAPQQHIGSQQIETQKHFFLEDGFVQVLQLLSLAIMAFSIAMILHYFVDKWILVAPGNASLSGGVSFTSWLFNLLFSIDIPNGDQDLTLLRLYIASLIISLPLFVGLFFLSVRRSLRTINYVNQNFRNVVAYLVLAMTFLIGVTTLILSVFHVINATITWTLALHFLITLVVSGLVASFYFFQIRRYHA